LIWVLYTNGITISAEVSLGRDHCDAPVDSVWVFATDLPLLGLPLVWCFVEYRVAGVS
jgi:hypothetical protein